MHKYYVYTQVQMNVPYSKVWPGNHCFQILWFYANYCDPRERRAILHAFRESEIGQYELRTRALERFSSAEKHCEIRIDSGGSFSTQITVVARYPSSLKRGNSSNGLRMSPKSTSLHSNQPRVK